MDGRTLRINQLPTICSSIRLKSQVSYSSHMGFPRVNLPPFGPMSYPLEYSPLRLAAGLGFAIASGLSVGAQTDLSHRQSELSVRVVNLAGDPVPGAEVSINMLNPAFRVGTAISVDEINPASSAYSPRAIEAAQRYFNSMTFGNFMKWTYVENRPAADSLHWVNQVYALNAFGSEDPMRLRGHTTIWGARYQLPADLLAMTAPSDIRARILSHIANYHTIFKDAGIDGFDLYNEPFHETESFRDQLLGTSNPTIEEFGAEVAPWFNRAKEIDPDAVLFINDYNMLNFWQENDSDIIDYKALVDAIRDAGGQIDGIGLQAHMDRFITKAQIKRRLDILAAPMAPTANFPAGLPGLKLEITELDINVDQWTTATPAQEAEVTANVLDAAFEHPAVTGVTIWGMNDGNHWRNNAILFDDSDPNNWIIKPSGQALIDRVKGTWWTNEAGTTDTAGSFAATVFKGKHQVTVRANGNTVQVVRDLTDDGTIELQVDDTPVDTTGSFLSNLSVRAPIASGETLKLGFVIGGGEKEILARVGGPVLADFGLNFLPDPRLEIRASEVVRGNNDDWVMADVQSTANALGAHPFAPGSKDAALIAALSGPHTSEITGDATGIVLGEIYDVTPSTAGPRLKNVSALHQTGVGDDVLIAGFYVGGAGKIRLLLRGVGPELALQPYGLQGMLVDPLIRLFRQADGSLVAANDNWDSSLASTFDEVGAFSLSSGSNDAAMVVLLDAGQAYTVQVVGADNGVGRAIIEVYEMD
jgi:GH35 family endo-1,4-beta-xylanase